MRDAQAGLVVPLVAVEQEIQVERARTIADAARSIAAVRALDRLQVREQLARRERRLRQQRAVQEAALPARAADRLGLDPARHGDHAHAADARDLAHRAIEMIAAVAQVAAQADGGDDERCAHVSSSPAAGGGFLPSTARARPNSTYPLKTMNRAGTGAIHKHRTP